MAPCFRWCDAYEQDSDGVWRLTSWRVQEAGRALDLDTGDFRTAAGTLGHAAFTGLKLEPAVPHGVRLI